MTTVASPSSCSLDGHTWPPCTFLLHDAKLNLLKNFTEEEVTLYPNDEF